MSSIGNKDTGTSSDKDYYTIQKGDKKTPITRTKKKNEKAKLTDVAKALLESTKANLASSEFIRAKTDLEYVKKKIDKKYQKGVNWLLRSFLYPKKLVQQLNERINFLNLMFTDLAYNDPKTFFQTLLSESLKEKNLTESDILFLASRLAEQCSSPDKLIKITDEIRLKGTSKELISAHTTLVNAKDALTYFTKEFQLPQKIIDGKKHLEEQKQTLLPDPKTNRITIKALIDAKNNVDMAYSVLEKFVNKDDNTIVSDLIESGWKNKFANSEQEEAFKNLASYFSELVTSRDQDGLTSVVKDLSSYSEELQNEIKQARAQKERIKSQTSSQAIFEELFKLEKEPPFQEQKKLSQYLACCFPKDKAQELIENLFEKSEYSEIETAIKQFNQVKTYVNEGLIPQFKERTINPHLEALKLQVSSDVTRRNITESLTAAEGFLTKFMTKDNQEVAEEIIKSFQEFPGDLGPRTTQFLIDCSIPEMIKNGTQEGSPSIQASLKDVQNKLLGISSKLNELTDKKTSPEIFQGLIKYLYPNMKPSVAKDISIYLGSRFSKEEAVQLTESAFYDNDFSKIADEIDKARSVLQKAHKAIQSGAFQPKKEESVSFTANKISVNDLLSSEEILKNTLKVPNPENFKKQFKEKNVLRPELGTKKYIVLKNLDTKETVVLVKKDDNKGLEPDNVYTYSVNDRGAIKYPDRSIQFELINASIQSREYGILQTLFQFEPLRGISNEAEKKIVVEALTKILQQKKQDSSHGIVQLRAIALLKAFGENVSQGDIDVIVKELHPPFSFYITQQEINLLELTDLQALKDMTSSTKQEARKAKEDAPVDKKAIDQEIAYKDPRVCNLQKQFNKTSKGEGKDQVKRELEKILTSCEIASRDQPQIGTIDGYFEEIEKRLEVAQKDQKRSECQTVAIEVAKKYRVVFEERKAHLYGLLAQKLKQLPPLEALYFAHVQNDLAKVCDLSNSDIAFVEEIRSALCLVLDAEQDLQKADRILAYIKNSRPESFNEKDFRIQLSQTRQYDSKELPHFQVFEILMNIYMRPTQVQHIQTLLEDKSIALQMLMGGGKTAVFLPLVALMKADGDALSTVLMPENILSSEGEKLKDKLSFFFERFVYEFPELPGGASPDSLKQIYENLLLVQKSKGCVFTTPNRKHSLFNNFTLALEGASSNEEKKKALFWCSKIIKLLDEKERVICDELDDVLKTKLQYIISLGTPAAFPKEESSLLAELVVRVAQRMPNLQLDFFHDVQTPASLTETQYDEQVLPNLISWSFELLKDKEYTKKSADTWAKILQEHGEPIKQYLSIRYRNETNEKQASEAELYVGTLEPSLRNQLAGLRQTLLHIMPTTFNNHYNSDYGLKKEQDKDATKTALAIPYSGPGKPSQTQFSSPHELCVRTIQAYIKANGIETIAKVKEGIFEQLQESQETIISTSQKLRLSSNKFSGITGTFWNISTMPEFDSVIPDSVTEGKSFLRLFEKEASGDISIKTTPDANVTKTLMEEIKAKGTKALIDTGGWLRNTSEYELAVLILKERPDLEAVVYHDEKGKKIALKRGQETAVEFKEDIPADKRFTIYGKAYSVGTDISQTKDAEAIFTVGKEMILRDFLQGAFRMRQLLDNQGLHILIDPEALGAMNEAVTIQDKEKPSFSELFAFLANNQVEQILGDNYSSAHQRSNCYIELAIRRKIVNTIVDLNLDADQKEKAALKKIDDLYKQNRSYFVSTKKQNAWEEHGTIPIQEECQEKVKKDIGSFAFKLKSLEIDEEEKNNIFAKILPSFNDPKLFKNKLDSQKQPEVGEQYQKQQVAVPELVVPEIEVVQEIESQKPQIQLQIQSEAQSEVQPQVIAAQPLSDEDRIHLAQQQRKELAQTLESDLQALSFLPQFKSIQDELQQWLKSETGTLDQNFIQDFIKTAYQKIETEIAKLTEKQFLHRIREMNISERLQEDVSNQVKRLEQAELLQQQKKEIKNQIEQARRNKQELDLHTPQILKAFSEKLLFSSKSVLERLQDENEDIDISQLNETEKALLEAAEQQREMLTLFKDSSIKPQAEIDTIIDTSSFIGESKEQVIQAQKLQKESYTALVAKLDNPPNTNFNDYKDEVSDLKSKLESASRDVQNKIAHAKSQLELNDLKRGFMQQVNTLQQNPFAKRIATQTAELTQNCAASSSQNDIQNQETIYNKLANEVSEAEQLESKLQMLQNQLIQDQLIQDRLHKNKDQHVSENKLSENISKVCSTIEQDLTNPQITLAEIESRISAVEKSYQESSQVAKLVDAYEKKRLTLDINQYSLPEIRSIQKVLDENSVLLSGIQKEIENGDVKINTSAKEIEKAIDSLNDVLANAEEKKIFRSLQHNLLQSAKLKFESQSCDNKKEIDAEIQQKISALDNEIQQNDSTDGLKQKVNELTTLINNITENFAHINESQKLVHQLQDKLYNWDKATIYINEQLVAVQQKIDDALYKADSGDLSKWTVSEKLVTDTQAQVQDIQAKATQLEEKLNFCSSEKRILEDEYATLGDSLEAACLSVQLRELETALQVMDAENAIETMHSYEKRVADVRQAREKYEKSNQNLINAQSEAINKSLQFQKITGKEVPEGILQKFEENQDRALQTIQLVQSSPNAAAILEEESSAIHKQVEISTESAKALDRLIKNYTESVDLIKSVFKGADQNLVEQFINNIKDLLVGEKAPSDAAAIIFKNLLSSLKSTEEFNLLENEPWLKNSISLREAFENAFIDLSAVFELMKRSIENVGKEANNYRDEVNNIAKALKTSDFAAVNVAYIENKLATWQNECALLEAAVQQTVEEQQLDSHSRLVQDRLSALKDGYKEILAQKKYAEEAIASLNQLPTLLEQAKEEKFNKLASQITKLIQQQKKEGAWNNFWAMFADSRLDAARLQDEIKKLNSQFQHLLEEKEQRRQLIHKLDTSLKQLAQTFSLSSNDIAKETSKLVEKLTDPDTDEEIIHETFFKTIQRLFAPISFEDLAGAQEALEAQNVDPQILSLYKDEIAHKLKEKQVNDVQASKIAVEKAINKAKQHDYLTGELQRLQKDVEQAASVNDVRRLDALTAEISQLATACTTFKKYEHQSKDSFPLIDLLDLYISEIKKCRSMLSQGKIPSFEQLENYLENAASTRKSIKEAELLLKKSPLERDISGFEAVEHSAYDQKLQRLSELRAKIDQFIEVSKEDQSLGENSNYALKYSQALTHLTDQYRSLHREVIEERANLLNASQQEFKELLQKIDTLQDNRFPNHFQDVSLRKKQLQVAFSSFALNSESSGALKEARDYFEKSKKALEDLNLRRTENEQIALPILHDLEDLSAVQQSSLATQVTIARLQDKVKRLLDSESSSKNEIEDCQKELIAFIQKCNEHELLSNVSDASLNQSTKNALAESKEYVHLLQVTKEQLHVRFQEKQNALLQQIERREISLDAAKKSLQDIKKQNSELNQLESKFNKLQKHYLPPEIQKLVAEAVQQIQADLRNPFKDLQEIQQKIEELDNSLPILTKASLTLAAQNKELSQITALQQELDTQYKQQINKQLSSITHALAQSAPEKFSSHQNFLSFYTQEQTPLSQNLNHLKDQVENLTAFSKIKKKVDVRSQENQQYISQLKEPTFNEIRKKYQAAKESLQTALNSTDTPLNVLQQKEEIFLSESETIKALAIRTQELQKQLATFKHLQNFAKTTAVGAINNRSADELGVEMIRSLTADSIPDIKIDQSQLPQTSQTIANAIWKKNNIENAQALSELGIDNQSYLKTIETHWDNNTQDSNLAAQMKSAALEAINSMNLETLKRTASFKKSLATFDLENLLKSRVDNIQKIKTALDAAKVDLESAISIGEQKLSLIPPLYTQLLVNLKDELSKQLVLAHSRLQEANKDEIISSQKALQKISQDIATQLTKFQEIETKTSFMKSLLNEKDYEKLFQMWGAMDEKQIDENIALHLTQDFLNKSSKIDIDSVSPTLVHAKDKLLLLQKVFRTTNEQETLIKDRALLGFDCTKFSKQISTERKELKLVDNFESLLEESCIHQTQSWNETQVNNALQQSNISQTIFKALQDRKETITEQKYLEQLKQLENHALFNNEINTQQSLLSEQKQEVTRQLQSLRTEASEHPFDKLEQLNTRLQLLSSLQNQVASLRETFKLELPVLANSAAALHFDKELKRQIDSKEDISLDRAVKAVLLEGSLELFSQIHLDGKKYPQSALLVDLYKDKAARYQIQKSLQSDLQKIDWMTSDLHKFQVRLEKINSDKGEDLFFTDELFSLFTSKLNARTDVELEKALKALNESPVQQFAQSVNQVQQHRQEQRNTLHTQNKDLSELKNKLIEAEKSAFQTQLKQIDEDAQDLMKATAEFGQTDLISRLLEKQQQQIMQLHKFHDAFTHIKENLGSFSLLSKQFESDCAVCATHEKYLESADAQAFSWIERASLEQLSHTPLAAVDAQKFPKTKSALDVISKKLESIELQRKQCDYAKKLGVNVSSFQLRIDKEMELKGISSSKIDEELENNVQSAVEKLVTGASFDELKELKTHPVELAYFKQTQQHSSRLEKLEEEHHLHVEAEQKLEQTISIAQLTCSSVESRFENVLGDEIAQIQKFIIQTHSENQKQDTESLKIATESLQKLQTNLKNGHTNLNHIHLQIDPILQGLSQNEPIEQNLLKLFHKTGSKEQLDTALSSYYGAEQLDQAMNIDLNKVSDELQTTKKQIQHLKEVFSGIDEHKKQVQELINLGIDVPKAHLCIEEERKSAKLNSNFLAQLNEEIRSVVANWTREQCEKADIQSKKDSFVHVALENQIESLLQKEFVDKARRQKELLEETSLNALFQEDKKRLIEEYNNLYQKAVDHPFDEIEKLDAKYAQLTDLNREYQSACNDLKPLIANLSARGEELVYADLAKQSKEIVQNTGHLSLDKALLSAISQESALDNLKFNLSDLASLPISQKILLQQRQQLNLKAIEGINALSSTYQLFSDRYERSIKENEIDTRFDIDLKNEIILNLKSLMADELKKIIKNIQLFDGLEMHSSLEERLHFLEDQQVLIGSIEHLYSRFLDLENNEKSEAQSYLNNARMASTAQQLNKIREKLKRSAFEYEKKALTRAQLLSTLNRQANEYKNLKGASDLVQEAIAACKQGSTFKPIRAAINKAASLAEQYNKINYLKQQTQILKQTIELGFSSVLAIDQNNQDLQLASKNAVEQISTEIAEIIKLCHSTTKTLDAQQEVSLSQLRAKMTSLDKQAEKLTSKFEKFFEYSQKLKESLRNLLDVGISDSAFENLCKLISSDRWNQFSSVKELKNQVVQVVINLSESGKVKQAVELAHLAGFDEKSSCIMICSILTKNNQTAVQSKIEVLLNEQLEDVDQMLNIESLQGKYSDFCKAERDNLEKICTDAKIDPELITSFLIAIDITAQKGTISLNTQAISPLAQGIVSMIDSSLSEEAVHSLANWVDGASEYLKNLNLSQMDESLQKDFKSAQEQVSLAQKLLNERIDQIQTSQHRIQRIAKKVLFSVGLASCALALPALGIGAGATLFCAQQALNQAISIAGDPIIEAATSRLPERLRSLTSFFLKAGVNVMTGSIVAYYKDIIINGISNVATLAKVSQTVAQEFVEQTAQTVTQETVHDALHFKILDDAKHIVFYGDPLSWGDPLREETAQKIWDILAPHLEKANLRSIDDVAEIARQFGI